MNPLKNLLHGTTSVCALALAFVFFYPMTAAARTVRARSQQGVGTFESRIDNFLLQSRLRIPKSEHKLMVVLKAGTNLKQIRLLIGAGPNSLAVGAVVVPKRDLRVTGDSMYKMMKLSYDLNYVRVCIDTDGDLIVMSKVRGEWLNLQEFKTTLDRVTAAADRAYGEMRPFLSTP